MVVNDSPLPENLAGNRRLATLWPPSALSTDSGFGLLHRDMQMLQGGAIDPSGWVVQAPIRPSAREYEGARNRAAANHPSWCVPGTARAAGGERTVPSMPGGFRSMPQPIVLIVDDVPENLTVLGELLYGEYTVRAANSGSAALHLARIDPQPDLILLDVMMPGMDGYEVMQRLHTDPATRHIPVICVTALSDTEDEERGLMLGAVDYITKPLKARVVLARVRSQIELKRARDRLADQNAFLEAEVARRMRENQLVQEASIHALARLAEMRDSETGNHLLRTQEYVRRLAQLLRHHPRFAAELDDHAIDLLARSAPLHDIGKVGIPDQILRKPGRLDSHEWEIMKTHAQIGAESIERAERDADHPIDFLAVAKQIARHHHERWDGRGYPDALAGDAIPLPARLMALADVFDALISKRIYKDAFPYTQARDMIAASRGAHLDPVVVDAFVGDFAAFCEIAERHADNGDAALAKRTSLRIVGGTSTRGPSKPS
jgi:putative two-component system response regulator